MILKRVYEACLGTTDRGDPSNPKAGHTKAFQAAFTQILKLR
jgi:hypothetical protein